MVSIWYLYISPSSQRACSPLPTTANTKGVPRYGRRRELWKFELCLIRQKGGIVLQPKLLHFSPELNIFNVWMWTSFLFPCVAWVSNVSLSDRFPTSFLKGTKTRKTNFCKMKQQINRRLYNQDEPIHERISWTNVPVAVDAGLDEMFSPYK